MEDIKIITEEATGKKYLQIDLSMFKTEDEMQDFIDLIHINLTKDEESIPWEDVTAELKRLGKI